MKKLLILLSVLFLISCSDTKTIHYKVKAGEHSSGAKVNILNDDVLSYSFTTDSSWVWEVPEKNGWSKVTGIAWNSNHQNSVRIVYMRLNDIGLLGYYYYLNGVSPQQNHVQKGILDTITIGHTYAGRLGYENGFYFVEMLDKHHSMKVGYPLPELPARNLQNLYIGGTYTIGHDWTSTVTIRKK
jgi:hypothetical protein